VDFSYSEEQQMLQDSVQKFVQRHYDFDARRKILTSADGFSQEHWQLFAELGWLTVPFSTEDDGFGGLATDLMVVMEEFGKAMLVEPFLATAVLGGGLISELGSGEQKAAALPAVMDGSLQLASALAETNGRYNMASVATTAQRDGDHYLVNGAKTLVLNAPVAHRLLVSVRTSGEVLDHSGVSLLAVDRGAEGVHLQTYATVDGFQAAEVTFDNVRVPVAERLGAEGAAFPAIETVVDRASLAICAEAIGAMDSLLTKTVEYTRIRRQFGTPIAAFQALQHRMADMFIECQLARSIVMMAAMTLDSDIDSRQHQKAVSAAKSRVGRAIRKVGQEAVQLHGGIGITDELDVGHLFKRVTAIETMFGNTDFHTARFARL